MRFFGSRMTGGGPVVVDGKVGRGVGFNLEISVLYRMVMVTMPAMTEMVRTTKAAASALDVKEPFMPKEVAASSCQS